MKPADKIRVAVLFGGRSAEHEVSLRSAENVMQYLDSSRFDVIPVGIDKAGKWYLGEEVFQKSLEHNEVPSIQENNPAWFAPDWVSHSVTQSQLEKIKLPSSDHSHFDVIFPVMHGTLCEDGTLQGLLEMADLPYVGCGVLSSAVGMDKDVSKRLAIHAGIPVAAFMAIKCSQWEHDNKKLLQKIEETISYPLFVKPANTGSSVGISKVKSKETLSAAIEEAFRFDTKILIEKGLNVVELEVAVLESLKPNEDPIVSVVGEIRPKHEFYSYDAKYVDDQGAELIVPASVSEEVKQAAREMAKKIFSALECEGMSRIDLFYDKDSKQLYFNEINTIPGFTTISMYPKLMDATGISYPELLTHLIQLAIKRYEYKNNLIRSYTD